MSAEIELQPNKLENLKTTVFTSLKNIVELLQHFEQPATNNLQSLKTEIEAAENAFKGMGLRAAPLEGPSVAVAQGGKKRTSKRGAAMRGGDAVMAADVQNLGNLIKDDHNPMNYINSSELGSILSPQQGATSGMRLTSNPATLLPLHGYNTVDPPLRGGGARKSKK